MARMPLNSESIVDKFDAEDGTDYGDGAVGGNDENAGNEEQEASGDEETGEEDTGSAEASGSDEGEGRTNSGSQEQQSEQLTAIPGNLAQDSKGNLYDRNGNMLARAGSERRLFERNNRMKADLAEKDNRINFLTQQLQTNTGLSEEPRRLGLVADDMRIGLPIIAEFKKDPVSAVRNMLEMVMGMGHNLSDILGNSAKDAVEMKAIQRMLDERLAPLQEAKQSAEQQRRETGYQQQAVQEVERFFDKHENSRVHAQVIDNLLGKREGMSPEDAYYELKVFAAQNGLDFSKPLAPQMQANVRATPGNRQQTRTVTRPMANGSGARRQTALPEAESLEANASWSDIISRSLKGVNG